MIDVFLPINRYANRTTSEMNPAQSSRKYFDAHRINEGPSASVGAIHTLASRRRSCKLVRFHSF